MSTTTGRVVSAEEARGLGDEYDDDINVSNLAHTVVHQSDTIWLLATACEEVLAAYHQLSGLGDEWKGNSDLAYETISGRLTEQAEQIAAVLALHKPTPVHAYDDANGVFVYGEDDEPVTIYRLCEGCTWDQTLEALGDCEWNEDLDGNVYWPCSTARALDVTT